MVITNIQLLIHNQNQNFQKTNFSFLLLICRFYLLMSKRCFDCLFLTFVYDTSIPRRGWKYQRISLISVAVSNQWTFHKIPIFSHYSNSTTFRRAGKNARHFLSFPVLPFTLEKVKFSIVIKYDTHNITWNASWAFLTFKVFLPPCSP